MINPNNYRNKAACTTSKSVWKKNAVVLFIFISSGDGVSWSLLLVRFIISTVLQTHSHVDSVNYHGEDLRQLRQGRNLEGGRSEHMHVCQPVGRQLHLHRAIAIDRWIFVGCIHTCTNRSTYATSWASQSKAGNNSRTVGPHGDLHPPNSLRKQ